MFKYLKKDYSESLSLVNLSIIPLALNTLISSFLPFSEAALGILSYECLYLHCHDCFKDLHWFKMLTFHGPFDLGEDPEGAQHQIWWTRWMRTHHSVFMSMPYWPYFSSYFIKYKNQDRQFPELLEKVQEW